MSTPINQLGTTDPVLTPSDLNGVAQEATLQDVAADITQIKTDVAALKTQALPLGPVHYHTRKFISGSGVELKWKDPADTVIAGYPAAYWKQTVIVRKEDADPTSITDGTVVLTTTTRDQYQHTSYLDTAGTANSHYRAFPSATNGYVNESADNIFTPYVLFGFTIDETDSNPATCITYTDANTDFGHIRMDFENDTILGTTDWMSAFFMPKPCMLHLADDNHAESYVDYYLDPSDYTKKADGVTASDVANTSYDGNAMMEFPPVFTKVEKVGSKIHFSICDIALDEGFEAWSAKTHDGTYANWYQAIYEGQSISNVMRSMSTGQKPTGSLTAANEWAYSQANNKSNDQGWGTTLWADEQTITILGWLVMKNLNSQEAIAGAYATASSLQINCGNGNAKGMFYGKNDGSYVASKFFGMENRWGHRNRRCQGINVVDYKIVVKMTLSNIDGSAGNIVASDNSIDYAGYIKTGDLVPAGINGAYINAINTGRFSACTAKAASGGSSSTFYCDGLYTSTGLRGVVFGGNLTDGLMAGLSFCYAYRAPSFAYWNFGASLSYHHF